MKLIRDDAVIDKIVQLVMDVQNQENTTIPLLEKQLREVDKKLDNLMKAIEDGLYTRTTKERLEALEIQKDELTAKIADEKLKKPSFNEDFIRFWLMKFRRFDISQKKQRKALIEIFVNAIFLYDDRMLLTFNYKDGTQTVRFEDTLTADGVEGKSSDLSSSAGPKIQRFHVRNRWIFLFIGWPHLVLTTMPKILSGRSQGQVGFFGRNSICCDMRASVDVNALKSWLAIIRAVPSNFQAENASLNNWIALCRMDS